MLDRDVAFALIKTEGLDAGRHARTARGAGDGALGAHPHIVTVFDIGEETRRRQPYIVCQCMAGGDVEGRSRGAGALPLERALRDRDGRLPRRWSSRTSTASCTATSSPATSG